MTDLLVLLTLHFVGDFLLQSDRMALNKSKDLRVLAEHAALYAVTVSTGVWLMTTGVALWFMLVTFAAHFLTDAVTSRWTSKLWFVDLLDRYKYVDETWPTKYGAYPFYGRVEPGKRHWFFVVIGLDQLLHTWQLGLTYAWLVR